MGLIYKLLSLVVGYRFRRRAACGNNTEIGWTAKAISHNKRQIQIGANCAIMSACICNSEGNIEIGPYTTVRYKSVIGSAIGIKIGSHCIISNNVTIYDHNSHPTDPDVRKKMCESGFNSSLWDWKYADKKPIVIKDNVWIGQNALICKGVTIGEGAVVAANAVVTKDVPAYSIAAGNPAKVVKTLQPQNRI
ncbi:acyltransferase [bacterium]|nr:acyltransferase [bacterium]